VKSSWIARISKDPFRLFFPVGWICGVAGVVSWVPFAWMTDPFYPGGFHAVLMSRAFISSFVLGFLMTAIPRFTETETARPSEWGIGIISVLAVIIAAFWGRTPVASALTLAQLIIVLAFIVRRFRARRNNPPGSFLFVAIGLLLGAVGSGVELISGIEGFNSDSWLDSNWLLLARLFSFYAMVLALVLGVGARLFPGILGWSEIVQAQRKQYERPVPFFESIPGDLRIAMPIFLISFFIEIFVQESLGRSIRACVVTYVAFRYWRVHRAPPKKSWMNRALLASAWCIVVGEWLSAVFPDWGLDGKHIVFLGFSLVALLVAARVTLAHGDGLHCESRAWPYLPVTIFVFLAALGRTGVHWTPGDYFPHLAYAAILWLVGAFIWGSFFLRRLRARQN
jgi:uncharacterized protein involved in response to NO